MAFPLSQAVVGALTCLLGAASAAAQPSDAQFSQPTGPEVLVTGVSPECRAPSSALYTTGALQNVELALQKKRSIGVLALGPFPSGGFGSGPASSKYTVRLQAELQKSLNGSSVEVEGRRLPGEITAGATESVTNTVMEVRPDLVIWSAGTHDALARVEPDSFAASVSEVLEWLRAHAIDVVIVEPPYAAAIADDQDYLALVRRLRAVAQDRDVPVVLRYDAMHYLSRQQTASADQEFELHDLSRRCIPEYVGLAVASSLGRALGRSGGGDAAQ